jgi:hypothetical protein
MSWNTDTDTDDMDLGFDVEATEAVSFDLLAKGEYPAIITGCTPKASANKPGSRYVSMEVTIIGGKGKGRKIWGNFTSHHATSATAVQIGRGHIKAAFMAAGVQSSSPIDLVAAQQPIMVSVGVEKGNDAYPDDKNTIKGFKPITPDQMAALEGGSEPAPAAPAKPTGKKPGFLK